MARSDLLLSLVRAGASGDRALFRRATEALIAEERAKRHDVFADRLTEEYARTANGGNGHAGTPNSLASRGLEQWVLQVTPRRELSDLLLHPAVASTVAEVVEEHRRADLLRAHNLQPRHRILLVGPPGNGKTSLAEALATELMVPLLVVRYETLIGSYLGETASRLGRLFELVRTYPCVLFLDEFDTLGKERGDTHETGEIKRVVSSLLGQVDGLPSHVCLVAATNHDELLDRAVWRRFQVRLLLDAPTRSEAIELVGRLAKRMRIDLGLTPDAIVDRLGRLSFAEIEEFVLDVARRTALAVPHGDPQRTTRSRLAQWQLRAGRAGRTEKKGKPRDESTTAADSA